MNKSYPVISLVLIAIIPPSWAQEPTPKELGEVTVRAARDPDLQEQLQSTSTKIIYGRDKLEKTADSTVAEFLKRLPGVTVSGTARNNAALLKMRESDLSRHLLNQFEEADLGNGEPL